jgi:hypothetical protein
MKIDPTDPAFPCYSDDYSGMSVRTFIAALCMAIRSANNKVSTDEDAVIAVEAADSLIEELNGRPPPE